MDEPMEWQAAGNGRMLVAIEVTGPWPERDHGPARILFYDEALDAMVVIAETDDLRMCTR